MSKVKDNKRILKAERKFFFLHTREPPKTISIFFKGNIASQEWHAILKVLKEKTCHQEYSTREAVLRNFRKDSFPDRQKLVDFITTRPALKEMLQELKQKQMGAN